MPEFKCPKCNASLGDTQPKVCTECGYKFPVLLLSIFGGLALLLVVFVLFISIRGCVRFIGNSVDDSRLETIARQHQKEAAAAKLFGGDNPILSHQIESTTSNIKRTIQVQLARRLRKTELFDAVNFVMRDYRSSFERTFITFYLPGTTEEVGGGWAVAHIEGT